MAFTQNPIATFVKQPRNWQATLVPGDAQALKALVIGGLNGSKCSGIVAASTDTAARDVQLTMNVGGTNTSGTVTGGTNFILGTVSIPAGAGNTSAVPSVDVTSGLNAANLPYVPGLLRDADGNGVFVVETLNFLCVSAPATVTAAKKIDFNAFGGDF